MESEEFKLYPEEEPLKMRRLSPDHPDFLENVEEQKSREARHLFGLDDLNIISQFEETMSHYPEGELTEQYGHFIDETLKHSMQELVILSTDKENQFASVGFETFFYESLDNSELAEQLKKIFSDEFIDAENGEIFITAQEILPRFMEIPLPLYRKMLERHVECYSESEKELQEKLPEWELAFADRLNEQVNKWNLALTKEEIFKRLEKVEVMAGDYLTYSDFTEADGDYHPASCTAVVPTGEIYMIKESGQSRDDYREYVYTHEMLHAVSGLTVMGGENSEGELAETQIRRHGLHAEGRFKWLNEAFTEFLALKLLGKEDSNSYKDERRELQLMIDKGVPEELFAAAYFENLEPGKTPRLKDLIKAVNQKCGIRYLQNLDKEFS